MHVNISYILKIYQDILIDKNPLISIHIHRFQDIISIQDSGFTFYLSEK